MHLTHQIVGAKHAAHGVGQRQRDSHRKPLGYSHHHQRDSYHERLEQIGNESYPVKRHVHEIHQQPASHDDCSHKIGYTRYKLSESVKLLIERSLDAIVNLRGLEHPSVLRGIANSCDAHHAMPLHYLGSTHHMVRGEGGVGVKQSRVSSLMAHRLAGERRFIHTQRHSLKQLSIGRNLLTCVQQHDITYHNVTARDLAYPLTAYHRHRLIIVHLIQKLKLLVGFEFKQKSKSGSEQNGYEYTYRLKEYSGILVKHIVLVDGNTY